MSRWRFLLVFFVFATPGVRAAIISVTNGDFDLLYKPGSTSITATIPPGAFTWGVGKNVPVTLGSASYSDGTTGNAVDVPGWTVADTHMGVQSPTPSYFHAGQSDSAPNFVFCNGTGFQAPITGAPMVSDTVTVIDADTAYTLSVRVGLREFVTPATPLRVELLANGQSLTPDAADSPALSQGNFVTWSRTYEVGSLAPYVGEPLTILLGDGASASGQQADFDSVSLVSSPEPGSLSLLVFSLLALPLRRWRSTASCSC